MPERAGIWCQSADSGAREREARLENTTAATTETLVDQSTIPLYCDDRLTFDRP